jgi:prepilin-type processing-associated H-X9-DG protein
VIAIIAILAAILFPVFAKVREKARASACISNEKQIGLALLQYEQDSSESLPYAFFGAGGGESSVASGRYKWMDAIYPYVKNEKVFTCPDQNFPSMAGYVYEYHYYANKASDTTHRYYGSYGINAMYRYDDITANRQPPVSIYGRSYPTLTSQIISPSDTVWIGDSDNTGGGSSYQIGWSTLAGQPAQIITTSVTPHKIDALVARHTDMTNIVFCDGHAKAMTFGDLSSKVAPDGKTLSYFTTTQD